MPKNQPIAEYLRRNFQTMLRAGGQGHLALVDCFDRHEQRKVALCCIIQQDPEAKDGVTITPVARMIDDDPFARYLPPDPDGGYDKGDDNEGVDRRHPSGQAGG